MMIRSYHEMIEIPSFEERLAYLSLRGQPGSMTFGGHRWMNQRLYASEEWRRIRRQVIIRDDGCDLAHPDYKLDRVWIHHINPITIDQLMNQDPEVFNLDNLVCVSFQTHNAIHYGREEQQLKLIAERSPNDTCPWLI